MMKSREASRLAGDFGTVVPKASRHRLFTAGGQALEAGGGPPALAACSSACVPPLRCRRCRASHYGRPDRRTEQAGMEGTAR